MKRYASLITNKSFILGISIGIGLCLGMYLSQEKLKKPVYKFNKALNYIEKYYVDKIGDADLEELTEVALAKLAKQLDPHTKYIGAKQSAINHAHLEGNFEGIGIEFALIDDTIYVLNPVPNGPAHQAGIQPGDKIIKIDDEDWLRKDLNHDKVIERIRGPKNSKLKLAIKRDNQKELLEITVVRGEIPTQAIKASYIITDKIGYVKLSHFGANTHEELMQKVTQLRDQGMQKLLLDLRNNSGGYLTPALHIAEEMLAPGKLILYTKGRYKDFNKEYYANGKNSLKRVPIIILLNEHSASASELLAGALQDHDRALIVGRRSFGKGLVQWPIEFKDKSVLNLTIERYFTPSGRLIQKPYDKRADYHYDLLTRYHNGEYFSADSIKFDPSSKYTTDAGRTVYGGGGIMPDVFIPLDITASSSYVNDLVDNYIIEQCAIQYTLTHKETLTGMTLEDYAKNFQVSKAMLMQVIELGRKLNVGQISITNEIEKSIKNLIKAHIAKLVWQEHGFYRMYNITDTTISKSLQLFNQAETLLKEDMDYIAERARKNVRVVLK
jgi:carboxyl-terminal processing protease